LRIHDTTDRVRVSLSEEKRVHAENTIRPNWDT